VTSSWARGCATWRSGRLRAGPPTRARARPRRRRRHGLASIRRATIVEAASPGLAIRGRRPTTSSGRPILQQPGGRSGRRTGRRPTGSRAGRRGASRPRVPSVAASPVRAKRLHRGWRTRATRRHAADHAVSATGTWARCGTRTVDVRFAHAWPHPQRARHRPATPGCPGRSARPDGPAAVVDCTTDGHWPVEIARILQPPASDELGEDAGEADRSPPPTARPNPAWVRGSDRHGGSPAGAGRRCRTRRPGRPRSPRRRRPARRRSRARSLAPFLRHPRTSWWVATLSRSRVTSAPLRAPVA
jgi:hypothetical protein